jgi:predicted SnoaL-like aldol condensation-catalyzing enzyme
MEMIVLRVLRRMLSVTLLSGLSGLTLAMAAPAAPGAQSRLQLDRDARAVMLAIFRQKDPHAVDRWFAKSFVQHDPTIADGIEGMKAFARQVAESPSANIVIYRVLVDHDLVLVHSKYEGLRDHPTPLIAFDLFRFKSGRIVEHWGGQEPETPPNPAGRTQVDGPTQVTDFDKTEANRALVERFKETVTVQRHFDRAGEFLSAHYAQHAAGVGDGIPRLNARFASMTQSKATATLIPRLYVAEGNFVLALVDANTAMGHTSNWDLFRVEGGRIVEHWDVLSKIPPPAQRRNRNDPF